MKKLILASALALLIGFGFTSCKTGYVPTPINAPMFQEKGQFAISAGLGYQFTFQAAYAVSDQFLVLADLNGSGPDSTGNTGTGSYYNHSWGFGYYSQIEKGWMMESVVGSGVGKQGDIAFSKYYLQQSFGTVSEHFEFSFTPRLMAVHYSNQPLGNSSGSGSGNSSATDIFIEPALQFRGGTLPVKFNFQLGLSLPLVNEAQLANVPLFWNFGLSYKLPAKKFRQAPGS